LSRILLAERTYVCLSRGPTVDAPASHALPARVVTQALAATAKGYLFWWLRCPFGLSRTRASASESSWPRERSDVVPYPWRGQLLSHLASFEHGLDVTVLAKPGKRLALGVFKAVQLGHPVQRLNVKHFI
jgi:hypothetical protein